MDLSALNEFDPAVWPENAYRAVAYGGGGLSFLMIAWSVWRMRKPRPLRLLSPMVAIIGAVASVIVYLYVAQVEIELLALAALVLAGVVVGQFGLQLIRVEGVDGRRFVRRSQWFLLLWGLSLVALQVTSVLDTPDSFAAGIAATIASAGLMGTVNLGLLVHRFRAVPGS